MPKKKETIISKTVNGVSSNAAAAPSAAPKEKKARTTKPKSVAKTVEAAPTPTYENTQEEIARLAYMFWQERGAVHGDPMQDWLKAENVVRQNGH